MSVWARPRTTQPVRKYPGDESRDETRLVGCYLVIYAVIWTILVISQQRSGPGPKKLLMFVFGSE